MKVFRFRRSDTGVVLEIPAESKNHARAQALLELGPDALAAGVTLARVFPNSKPEGTAAQFLNEDRRDRRTEKRLGIPAGISYYL